MGSFLAHVHTGIERSDRPDGRQPREHEAPTCRPSGVVLDMTEDVAAGVDGRIVVGFTNGECNDGGQDEADVDVYAGRLDLGHDPAEERRDESVADHAGGVGSVHNGTGRFPFAVTGDGDKGEQHQGESVCL